MFCNCFLFPMLHKCVNASLQYYFFCDTNKLLHFFWKFCIIWWEYFPSFVRMSFSLSCRLGTQKPSSGRISQLFISSNMITCLAYSVMIICIILLLRHGCQGWFLLVPAHPGSSGQRVVKRVCVCVCRSFRQTATLTRPSITTWRVRSSHDMFAFTHSSGTVTSACVPDCWAVHTQVSDLSDVH